MAKMVLQIAGDATAFTLFLWSTDSLDSSRNVIGRNGYFGDAGAEYTYDRGDTWNPTRKSISYRTRLHAMDNNKWVKFSAIAEILNSKSQTRESWELLSGALEPGFVAEINSKISPLR